MWTGQGGQGKEEEGREISRQTGPASGPASGQPPAAGWLAGSGSGHADSLKTRRTRVRARAARGEVKWTISFAATSGPNANRGPLRFDLSPGTSSSALSIRIPVNELSR